jgi:hypothetical protein
MGFSYARQHIILFLTKSIKYVGRYLSHSWYKEVNINCNVLQAISLLHSAIQHFQSVPQWRVKFCGPCCTHAYLELLSPKRKSSQHISAMGDARNIPVIISGNNVIPSFTLLPTTMFQSVSPIFLFSTSPIEVYSVFWAAMCRIAEEVPPPSKYGGTRFLQNIGKFLPE